MVASGVRPRGSMRPCSSARRVISFVYGGVYLFFHLIFTVDVASPPALATARAFTSPAILRPKVTFTSSGGWTSPDTVRTMA